jgi:hypothetical protein
VRIGRARPDLAAAVEALCESYSRLRYAAASPEHAADLEAFIAEVLAFHPRRRPPENGRVPAGAA